MLLRSGSFGEGIVFPQGNESFGGHRTSRAGE